MSQDFLHNGLQDGINIFHSNIVFVDKSRQQIEETTAQSFQLLFPGPLLNSLLHDCTIKVNINDEWIWPLQGHTYSG